MSTEHQVPVAVEVWMEIELQTFIDLPMVLVSGQARSGTTVLTKAIGNHSQVFSNLKESNFVVDVVWSIMRACKMEARRSQLVVSEADFQSTFKTALWDVLFPRTLWEPSHQPSVVSTFSAMRSEVAEFLVEFLPDVRIVNIVRNGVEVVASRVAHKHIGKRSFQEHCVAWAAAMDMISWGQQYPENFFLVRHESLLQVDSTEHVFESLFRWLQLSSDPACAGFVAKGIINTTRSDDDTDQSAQDLSTRGDRWRSWTADQRSTFEDVCGTAMNQLGYSIPWR